MSRRAPGGRLPWRSIDARTHVRHHARPGRSGCKGGAMRFAWNGWVVAACAALALVAAPSDAKTFRWASQGDILSFDPFSQNESFNNTFNSYVYESLVQYDKKFDIVPQRAT